MTGPPRDRLVHVVVPGDIDDAAVPSGGNVYDRRVCRELAGTGWVVREIAAPGTWPRPESDARTALARALDDVPDDEVVLLDGLVVCGVPEVVRPRAERLRLVVLVHLPLGDEVGLDAATAAELAAREGETLRAARAVVTTSQWAARRVRDVHGLDADRVEVATPGVDAAPLASGTDGAGRLLCVGSLTPTKGQDLLVEALAAMGDPGVPDWTCELVGSLRRHPAHVAAVQLAVRRHGLSERVRITGPRTGSELADSYAAADLVVLPSRAEAFGMVLVEALARGIPVIATDVGGVPEALGRDRRGRIPGILVPPGDPHALADALRTWFVEPALREELRGAARSRRAELTGWEVTSRCLAAVLQRVRGMPA